MTMREILFRGKRIDNGEWVIGFYVRVNESDFICTRQLIHGGLYTVSKSFEVNPSTICQCTGLKDKNGKLIWENDIVRDEHGIFYKAFWQNNYYQFSWICVKAGVFSVGTKWDLWSFKSFEIEVIGNVFDNPELLESEELL